MPRVVVTLNHWKVLRNMLTVRRYFLYQFTHAARIPRHRHRHPRDGVGVGFVESGLIAPTDSLALTQTRYYLLILAL